MTITEFDTLMTLDRPGFITRYGSGTLRRCAELGAATHGMYLAERAAFTFGYPFMVLARTRMTYGDVIAMSDCPAITEAAFKFQSWSIRMAPLGIRAEFKWAKADVQAGKGGEARKINGPAAIIKSPIPWISERQICVAFLAEVDYDGEVERHRDL